MLSKRMRGDNGVLQVGLGLMSRRSLQLCSIEWNFNDLHLPLPIGRPIGPEQRLSGFEIEISNPHYGKRSLRRLTGRRARLQIRFHLRLISVPLA
jgi:hypothetical protein